MKTSHCHYAKLTAAACSLLFLASCTDDLPGTFGTAGSERPVFEFSATIDQDNSSRADESGFADGDRMGVFVVNYRDNAPGTLSLSDNQVNNVAVTFSAENNKWIPATDIYWLDGETRADIYGYYPFNNALSDVNEYSFEVRGDQSIAGDDSDMGSYEASDFLWAKDAGVAPGTKVSLTYRHALAGVKVSLLPGEGYSAEEWAKLSRIVTVDNTVRSAEIDLSTGNVTPTGNFDRNIVMNPEPECYRAVVIPQTVAAGKSIIGITVDGVTCNYKRDGGGMSYTPGKLHQFTIKVNRSDNQGNFTLELVSEDITPWEVDNSSHDFEANSYLVVNVPEPGTLKSCLAAVGADYSTVKNLKITGKLTDEDFRFMREEMSSLTAINLKEAKMVHIKHWMEDKYSDDVMPSYAFDDKPSLRRVVLPESVEMLDDGCLSRLTLSGTIIIPESVKEVGPEAFYGTNGEFTVVLPSKLEIISESAFLESSVKIDLRLPNTLKHIGNAAFAYCDNIYGTFSLPSKLEFLGKGAFKNCGTGLTGEIVIPENITVVPDYAFGGMGFGQPVKLQLHDGIREIGSGSFCNLKFSSPVSLPEGLNVIRSGAFSGCRFTGDLRLPDNLQSIGEEAFSDTNISGTLTLPRGLDFFGAISDDVWIGNYGPFSGTHIDRLILGDNVEQIGSWVSYDCPELKYVQIGKNVSSIGECAFYQCPGINTIVCLAKEPPSLPASAFASVDVTHCVVEVPEESVEAYRRASGWSAFRSITAHHELSLSLSEISCLNKGISRNIILRAEGPWEVAESPAWIHITPDHAEYKEEITVTVDPLVIGSGFREGRVVFRLKESGYTTYLTVRQYDYEHEEDKEIVLQTASGAGTAIPVFIIGEGYGAEPIASGNFLKIVNETVEQFFAIEPYKSYREMFTVSTAVALSPDDGAPDMFSVKESKFSLTFPDIDLPDRLKDYVKDVSANIDDRNIGDALIIVLSNYNAFAGSSLICDDGCGIANIGISDEPYPYDSRALVQRYAGGEAFAGLATEGISHFESIKGCTCPFCNKLQVYREMKARGLFENVSLSGKTDDSPWRDFIYHPKYSAMVDMWEGGFEHLRGVWRSEANSVMNNYIPYYNTISRYAIYKHIMRRAGLGASLEAFIANDKIEIPQ